MNSGSTNATSAQSDWEQWVTQHAPKFLLFARQQTRLEADAQDLVQEAADVAGVRELESGAVGLAEHDLFCALDTQFRMIVESLSPSNVKSYASSIPQDALPVAVNSLLNGPGRHEFVRSAPVTDAGR